MLRQKSLIPRIGLGISILMTATLSLFSQSPQSLYSGAWAPIGPRPTFPAGALTGTPGATSGRVTAIAIDPTDATGNTVFIGGAEGGVWKTTTGGISVNGAAAWTPLTDNQPSLSIGALAIAIDPSNSQEANHRVIYAATGEQAGLGFDAYYGAGVLKSLDGGNTWAQTCQGTVFSNSLCPFVGPFGETFFPGGGARIGSLAVSPGNPQMLLAGVEMFAGSGLTSPLGQPGIYCSANAGAAWVRIAPSGLSSTAMATAVFFASPTTAYAAIGRASGDPTNGIYVSRNADQTCAGQTWTRLTGIDSVVSKASMGRIELTAAPGNLNVLYAGIADAATGSNSLVAGGGVFRSGDGGNTWTVTSAPDFCHAECWDDLVIRVDPADATGNTVFAGGSDAKDGQGNSLTLNRSIDGGNTWSSVSATNVQGTFLHTGQHAIAFTAIGSALYVGNDGGVWSSANAANPATAPGSQTWANLNSGLAVTQFNPGFSIHPSTPAEGFGGTQENGPQVYAGDGTASAPWLNSLACVNGGYTIIDPALPTTFLVACGSTSGASVFRSDASGAAGSFFSAAAGISTSDPINTNPPFVADPSTPGRYYFGTNQLYQTGNRAGSWTMISCHVANCAQSASGDLTSGEGNFLTAIGVSPSVPAVVYVGASDATVQITKNAGPATTVTFTNVSAGLPPRAVAKIFVDPADLAGNTAYVAFAGFAIDQSLNGATADLQGHIFKTVNGGTNWADVSCHTSDCAAPLVSDLPNTPVNDLILDPDDPARNTLYAATDIGMYVTTNGGSSWAAMGTGLPNVPVLSLALHEPSRTLLAATHGRSAWVFLLPSLALTPAFELSSLSSNSASTGRSAPLQLTLTGRGFTSNSSVLWNGSSMGLSIVGTPTATSIVVNIAASLFAQSGNASVQVMDASHSPTTTNALPFSVPGSVPILTSIQPSSVSVGAANTQVLLTGSNFTQAALVTLNGAATGVTINSVNSAGTQISVTLSSALFQYGGEFIIGVMNPPPGGGTASPGAVFTVNSLGPPANDNLANATIVTTANLVSTVDNFAATSESTDPTPSCIAGSSKNPTGKSVWWEYTAGSGSTITAGTAGSAYDAVMDVQTGSPGSFTEVTCNHDASSAHNSSVQFTAKAGTTYYFMVTVFDTSLCSGASPNVLECGGKTVFNFSGPSPAGVTASPSAVTISAGGSASYNIGTFSPPLSGNVTLTVSGCPSLSTCTFSSTSIAAGMSSTLAVTTTANSTSGLLPMRKRTPILPVKALREVLIFAGLALTVILLMQRKRTPPRRNLTWLPFAILLLFSGVWLTGCFAFAESVPPVAIPGTPGGIYSLVVTATGNGNTTATTTVTLTVD
ncbi:MAG TPA: sialidase family protein [Candidatus Acidoferrales bacterium]|jgi:hypothetical protein|nr:sialidase family protein [Candidatus Acidoferrales bacterium]